MSNHAKPFEFHPTDGSSNLSFRERLAIWCKKYLKDLRGGIYVYPHQTSAGKAIAPALRYHLLSQPVCEAAVAYGANTDFGANIRRSEANPTAIRDLPTQEQAKTQFWVDLFADDVRLLEHLIDKLGNEPAREEQAVWRTFSEKVFKRKPSLGANPLDLAAHIAHEWMDLKLSDCSFETTLQSAWAATMEHLLTEVFTGDLKAAVGDVIAKDRQLIDSPQKLIDKIQECCKVVQDNQQQFRFVQALSGNGNGSSSAATSGATTSNPSRHPKDRRRSTERPGSNARPGQEPKPKENELCRNFLAGKCARGAQCKYSHAAQPPQQPASTPHAAKRLKTASAKRLTASAGEIVEGGITYRLYKDGKYYERSPCSFCWQPESTMGATRHTNEDCPIKAKCTDDAQRQRAYKSRCREKP